MNHNTKQNESRKHQYHFFVQYLAGPGWFFHGKNEQKQNHQGQ
ncbi:hypothetical protein [Desulfosporosinus fructosivorans]